MSCKDCQNNIPDRTVDLGCGGEPLDLNTTEQISVAPSTSVTSSSFREPDKPLDAVQYVSSAVKDISVRFGRVQPGIFLTEDDASSLNREVGIIFEDIEKGLSQLIEKMVERENQINDFVQSKIKENSVNATLQDISKPCENIFDGFKVENPVLDWENPIASSVLIPVGTCRLVAGCAFCDLPGDINIPPFPGIPSCNFTPIKSDLCGFEFLDPFATIQNVVEGFQLFATQVGSFAYAFVDLANLATGFLGRCIMRVLNCLSSFFTGQTLSGKLNAVSAPIREQILATKAAVTGYFAGINAVFDTIQQIVYSAIGELFTFMNEILSLCDPCALVETITNPASIQLPSFGGIFQ